MSMLNKAWPADAKYLQIGDICLDLRYRSVLRDGEAVELQQRIFDLMLLFVAEPHKLHTRAELFSRLWPGLVVDDANLSQNVWLLRKALGESRKHWLRTIAKRGYVFESPSEVTWSNEWPNAEPSASSGQSSRLPPALDAASAVPSPRESLVQGFGRRRWGHWAAAVALLGVVGVGLIVWRSGSDRPTPDKPLTVALILVQDSADTPQWPARLLQDWLGWKLGSLPEVNVINEADLAADTSTQSPVAVYLTSGRAPGADGHVVVRARWQGLGKEQRLEATGPLAQVPAMVDGLSQQIIEHLDSPRTEPWPPLDITATAAERYVHAVDAVDRRDWMAVAAIGAEVIRKAPRFGLMRLQLARAQSRLALSTAAKEQMEIARGLLRPIPDDAKALLDAQILAIDPERAEQAAEAFGKIAALYPAKQAYTLEHARLLVASGQPKQALTLLQANPIQRSSVGTRITRHLIAASAAGAMYDPDLQRLHARAAENLARIAGRGWELERAKALVAMGSADRTQYPERRDTRLFKEASNQFDRAGNTTGALHAQFLAETAAPPVSGPNPRLDILLAKARAGGNRGLEIAIMFDLALQHERSGDIVGYRDWLEQAWARAQDSGNSASRDRLDLMLATNDFLEMRLSDADVRLARLTRADPTGGVGGGVYGLLADVHRTRGNIPAALEALSKSAGKLSAWSRGQPVPEAVALTACTSAGLRLSAGDLDGARKDMGLCNETKMLAGQNHALTGSALIEWAAGNRADAELAVAQARVLPSTLWRA